MRPAKEKELGYDGTRLLLATKTVGFILTAWLSANLFLLFLRGSIGYSDAVGAVENPSDHGALFFLAAGVLLVLGNAWLVIPKRITKRVEAAGPTLLESARPGIEERFSFWVLISAALALVFSILLFISIRQEGRYPWPMDWLWSIWR